MKFCGIAGSIFLYIGAVLAAKQYPEWTTYCIGVGAFAGGAYTHFAGARGKQ